MRIIALMLAFTMLSAPVLAAEPTDNGTTLDISAQADAKAEPDIAVISAGVLTVAKTADAAMKENSTKMNAMFAALKKAGVASKDQQTSGINIQPQYVYIENKSPQITGYQASNTVSVTLRDLKNVGPVLDAVIAQGANQVNGPTFTLENPETLLNETRRDAVKKARARAELYADATGMKIKKIRSISENSNVGNPQPYPVMARMMKAQSAEAADATPIAKGEINLTVNVNISYELE